MQFRAVWTEKHMYLREGHAKCGRIMQNSGLRDCMMLFTILHHLLRVELAVANSAVVSFFHLLTEAGN